MKMITVISYLIELHLEFSLSFIFFRTDKYFLLEDICITSSRLNALNSGSVLNTINGNRLLYTMKSHFAAFGRISH